MNIVIKMKRWGEFSVYGKKVLEEDIGKVKALIGQVFGKCDYKTIERLGGLTNHTYKVGLEDGKTYWINGRDIL